MRSDPTILVECDGDECSYEEELHMTPLSGSSWDERHLDADLRARGWRIEDGKDFCPDCADEQDDSLHRP